MPEAILGSIAGPVIGGLLGSGGSSSTQTQQNQIDPRMAKYIYGDDNTQGLLDSAYNWYNKNRSGLNDQMLQGLNSQWNVLSNPSTMAGYQQQAALGSGLMSAPVMGNPFADGRASLRSSTSGPSSNLGFGPPIQAAGASGGNGRQQPQPVRQSNSYGLSDFLPANTGSYGGAGPFQAAAPAPVPAQSNPGAMTMDQFAKLYQQYMKSLPQPDAWTGGGGDGGGGY